MNTFSEAIYFLHVEIMANLDHYKSIELETSYKQFRVTNTEMAVHWNHADANMICPTLK